MTGWRLLLTRPAEESAALAAELAAAGVYSSSLPLLAISPVTVTDAQRALIAGLDRYCAVIVVSKPAARLGLELVSQHWPQVPRQKWFSVGAATAQILAGYGLDVSYPQQGDDSEALLAMPEFKSAVGGEHPRVLILRGRAVVRCLRIVCAASAHKSTTLNSIAVSCRHTRLQPCISALKWNA